nr:truncated env [Desmodus rotundus endogenous retrovirus]
MMPHLYSLPLIIVYQAPALLNAQLFMITCIQPAITRFTLAQKAVRPISPRESKRTAPPFSALKTPYGYLPDKCPGEIGKPACWKLDSPLGSDGGGPQDKRRTERVRIQIKKLLDHGPDPVFQASDLATIDEQTLEILTTTHQAINDSNPILANHCWLCMKQSFSTPLAIPSNISSFNNSNTYCTLNVPFRVQPMLFYSSPCIYKRPQNNSFDISVGFASFTNCSHTLNYSTSLCPGPGRAFICGNNLAFTALPANWTGLCVLAALLPDIDIIPGDEPVPIPAFDHFAGRHKRALAIIPLLVGLGVSGAVATGTAGLGVAVHSYTKLSKQLVDDVQALSSTITDIQDQLDSLAEVVL